MLEIDTSLGGEEDVERRSSILRTMDLETDVLDEMQQWLEKKTLGTHAIAVCYKVNGSKQLKESEIWSDILRLTLFRNRIGID